MQPFPYYKQLNAMDCGPTCLRMVAKYYGRHYNADTLRQRTGFSKEGVSLLGISETAENIGFRTRGVKIDYFQLSQIALPCILHWDQNHFVVLTDISKNKAKIADPGKGVITLSKNDFLHHWISSETEGEQVGVALLLETTPVFFDADGEKEHKLSWRLVFQYLAQSRFQITQVFIALIITSLLQLVVPFLTQSIVDTGINTQNLQFVVIVLIAQLMLTFSQTIVDFIRSRLLLRISNILNIQILSDFWIKLTRLPLSYFDVYHTGDTLQRIGDHKTIQNFLDRNGIKHDVFCFYFCGICYCIDDVQCRIILCLYDWQSYLFCLGANILAHS
ncbi:MAG: cysteine peptidase family C39 domain-containing protein [Arachidicoccus sp.]|nr:cysteine peptidase family C39 domain-containing protein [Arachidicoccus sp.]